MSFSDKCHKYGNFWSSEYVNVLVMMKRHHIFIMIHKSLSFNDIISLLIAFINKNLFTYCFICCYRADVTARSLLVSTSTRHSTSRTSSSSTGGITSPLRMHSCSRWGSPLVSLSSPDKYLLLL